MRKAVITVIALVTATLVSGCGGGSGSPQAPSGSSSARALLKRTFDGHHTINSGVLSLDLKIVPSGSSTITQPVELSFGGPFTSTGAGKLPESDFTISGSAQGQTGSLQLISAGGRGYITVSGQSYEMPASSFKNVESGFGSLSGTGATGSSTGSGPLGSLGIKPLDWLTDPQIVGHGNLYGAPTTHIHAKVDSTALLHDLSKLLGKAASLGVSGTSSLPHSISKSTQTRIAKALGSPDFNVWTGTRDRIVRRLTVDAKIPVTGEVRTLLGGMTSAAVTLEFQYRDINRPQTITAPTSVQPYSVFQSKVDTVLQELESALVSGELGGGTGTGQSASPVPGVNDRYTQCIAKAAGDVAKMQRCSSLLGSG